MTEKHELATLEGQKIEEVRRMTDEEVKDEGWRLDNINPNPVVIITEKGNKVYPSKDPEGNGFGCLFQEYDGHKFYVGDEL